MADGSAYAVDRHPDRNRLINMMLAGASVRAVAKVAGCSSSAVHRYRRDIVFPAVKKSSKSLNTTKLRLTPQEVVEKAMVETKQEISERPVEAALARKLSRIAAHVDRPYAERDWRGASALETAETQALRLAAEMAGLLSAAGQVTVNAAVLVMPPMPQAPQALVVVEGTADEAD